ncbi:MAG: Zn-dependent hydrolase [Chloroflexota bacterium]|nr:Zn-dependent hydrolase [Chloroflexota bacterium]
MVFGWLNLKVNSERLQADFDALAEIGVTMGGGVSRLALSNEDLAARSWYADRIEEAGLQIRDDEAGNLSGLLCSDDPKAKTLMLGSHLDTVPNGGRYDGAIGVLIALECLRRIRESGIKPKYHLEAINFTDEEGTWHSLFGSNAIIGNLSADDLSESLRANGAFRAALYRAGIRPDEIQRAQRNPHDILGYLEVHIEQSNSLHEQGAELGIVDRIVGRSTYNVTFYGEAAHAGTTTAEERRDALQGAAAFIILAHKLITEEYPEGVINCGHVSVKPDTFNVVPAEASLRVEFRHPDTTMLTEMEARLIRLSQDCAKSYRLSVGVDRVLRREAERMSPDLVHHLEQACRLEKVSYMTIASYSGHNAQIMNQMVPAGMIFLPSVDGISHNPKEFTEWRHVEVGANVLLRTILQLAV